MLWSNDRMVDKSWEGNVQFYELAFGTWIAYLFLVFLWKKIFKTDHEGWRYALIILIGGSFYIINHYFLHAPFYSVLINAYSMYFPSWAGLSLSPRCGFNPD